MLDFVRQCFNVFRSQVSWSVEDSSVGLAFSPCYLCFSKVRLVVEDPSVGTIDRVGFLVI